MRERVRMSEIVRLTGCGVHVCLYIYMCVCTCVCLCVYVCLCVCEREREGGVERETEVKAVTEVCNRRVPVNSKWGGGHVETSEKEARRNSCPSRLQ